MGAPFGGLIVPLGAGEVGAAEVVGFGADEAVALGLGSTEAVGGVVAEGAALEATGGGVDVDGGGAADAGTVGCSPLRIATATTPPTIAAASSA